MKHIMMTKSRTYVVGILTGIAITSTLMNYLAVPALSKEKPVKDNTESEESQEYVCNIPALTDLEQFYDYGNPPVAHCENLKEVGGAKTDDGDDGSKFVCFDDPFKLKPGNCVVLSFGINKDWSFDDAMDELGCTVYAFDPTIGNRSFDRSKNIHFYNLGLSNITGTQQIGQKICEVDRYENILRKLGLLDTEIDYLKIDIETSEIPFFQDILSTNPFLLKNVKQIGMEIHPLTPPLKSIKESNYYPLWIGMKSLECLGFEVLHMEKNRVKLNHFIWKKRTESVCYEVLWIRHHSQ